MALTQRELARRLCVRNHPYLHTTGARVPCGVHVQEADRYWQLATPNGRHSFEVIRDARDEFRVDEVEVTAPFAGSVIP